MDAWRNFCRRWLWLVAAALMLGYTATDTVVHLRTTWQVSDQHLGNLPQIDANSPTGYAWNEHDFILPYVGMDGYHWVLQTQEMLAGAGVRVRHVDYDNYPVGRDVHWSSSYRWWIAAVAWVNHFYTGTPLPIAVERVMPYANTVLIMLIMMGVLFVISQRLGSVPATLLALGMITVSPVYISYAEGKSDHHGLTVVCAMLTVLFLVCGGAGWVRADHSSPTSGGDPEADLRSWFLERSRARQWFIASGIAGGAGLWVSAATEVPVLAEVGLAALLADGWLARGAGADEPAKPDSSLWRVWGWSGAAASIFFYLLEYFPAHFGLRLEVNHPLYALAWAGGGEVLFRLCRWFGGVPFSTRDKVCLAAGVVAVALAPFVALAFADRTFWVADRFLFNFHEDYIAEFKSMARYVVDLDWMQRLEVINALVLMVIPMVAWIWRPMAAAVMLAAFALATLIAFVARLHFWEPGFAGLFAALAVEAVLLGIFAWRSRLPEFPRPAKALMVLTLLPAVATYFVSLRQMRWIEISYTLWLVALVVVAAVVTRRPDFRWPWGRRALVAIFLASVFVPAPAHMVEQWFRRGWKAPASDVEIMEIISRDVAQRLRLREGDKVGVIVSGPTTTTWMIYWGGFKGLGTLYWENLAGMKATADIYAATSDSAAYDLVKKYGVTHFVIFPWDEFALQYARLKNNLRSTDDPPPNSFVLKLMNTDVAPQWLRPIYYPLPAILPNNQAYVRIWEVDPGQTAAEAQVRQAQWDAAAGNNQRAFELLFNVLQSKPYDLAALTTTARLASVANQSQLFAESLQRIRLNLAEADNLSLGDRIDLATVFRLAADEPELRRQITACLDAATSGHLRKLEPEQIYNLLSLAYALGLADHRPGLWNYALSLLPVTTRAQLLVDAAGTEMTAHHTPAAIVQLRRALSDNPDSVIALANLASILATSSDAKLRDGHEALALAQKANELDKNEHVDVRDILACAYAECGEFDIAAHLEASCIKTAEDNKALELAAKYRQHLALFQQRQPYHAPEN